jgi:hypothetical protein
MDINLEHSPQPYRQPLPAELYLSEGTIRNRITDILNKSGLTNRTQLAVAWINSGEQYAKITQRRLKT